MIELLLSLGLATATPAPAQLAPACKPKPRTIKKFSPCDPCRFILRSSKRVACWKAKGVK